MITAGIDMGSRSIKIVLLEDIQVEGAPQMKYAQKKPYLMLPGDMDADQAATIAFDNACREAGVDKDSVTRIYTTRAGRKQVAFTKEWANQSGREVQTVRRRGAIRCVNAPQTAHMRIMTNTGYYFFGKACDKAWRR